MAARKPMHARLEWRGEQLFEGTVDGTPVAVDGKSAAGASPVQMLAAGLAGCMAIDVVHILGKMRTPADALAVELTLERADADPRRVVSAALRFDVSGVVPDKNVQRALDMSHDTYCSVWHSLRQDIELRLSFTVTAG